MTRFSANLGFLWKDLPLPDAIRAAKRAGFDAVECHWPFETPVEEVTDALSETGLRMMGLNTVRGAPGENGLAALPGREVEARAAIDQAIAYAAAIGASNVHVMAGCAAGPAAEKTFVANLSHACDYAALHGITILIEPLNHYDAPGYFLSTSGQAVAIIEKLGRSNLKLMFDCYHLQIMEGDLTRLLTRRLEVIGHVQFASVPDRSEPDCGEVNYAHVFAHLDALGYTAPLGAEYTPRGATDAGLGWMSAYRSVPVSAS
jgi:hydroxypyruvate isomerase